jgi:Tol biopolymer transport system component
MTAVAPLRVFLLVALFVAALAAMYWSRAATSAADDAWRHMYVTTAAQQGVVGYRDPVGAVSPDGSRVAFAEGRRLFEMPVDGGARVELAMADGQIRHLASDGRGAWIFEDATSSIRWWLAATGTPKRPLFGERQEIEAGGTPPVRRRVSDLRQLAASNDGQWLAAVATTSAGAELWRVAADGSNAQLTRLAGRVAWPAWAPDGEIACTVIPADAAAPATWRVSMPCGQSPLAFEPDREVIGPLGFSPTTRAMFFASPNAAGFVDLWEADPTRRTARRVSSFGRDSYAPSVTNDGRVLFKTQTYRTAVAEIDLSTRRFQQLSTLQAETPSYHPDGRRIAVTYGTWRRVIDDAKYPDIAQEIGVIRAMPVDRMADAPSQVIAESDSEDQAMAWSPNGRWIAFHTHREQSDDIWLRPTDGTAPDRRVSFLGRGAEVGWPRWSPDGRWVLYDGASPATGRSVMFVIGIDQDTGAITAEPREVAVVGFDGDITHGEWLVDSATLVAIAKEGPGRHVILTVPAASGPPRIVHRFATEHDFPGLGISPDGRHVAFVAPATDGYYQIFRMPVAGGAPEQVTTDPSHKTQPAWSPDGTRIAYTVWSYVAQFWMAS